MRGAETFLPGSLSIEGRYSVSALSTCLSGGFLGKHRGVWVLSKCHMQFFSKSVSQSQARPAQARSSQPPHSSTKKASTDLLADIGGDPFAAPQTAPAFATFPAFGGKWDL